MKKGLKSFTSLVFVLACLFLVLIYLPFSERKYECKGVFTSESSEKANAVSYINLEKISPLVSLSSGAIGGLSIEVISDSGNYIEWASYFRLKTDDFYDQGIYDVLKGKEKLGGFRKNTITSTLELFQTPYGRYSATCLPL